jgi:hypothetical protein
MAIVTAELNGQTYTRDTTKLPQASQDYLLQNGFSQRIRDVYASCTEKAFPDPVVRNAERAKKVAHALKQMDTGDFKSRETISPQEAAMREMVRGLLAKGHTVEEVAAQMAKSEKPAKKSA